MKTPVIKYKTRITYADNSKPPRWSVYGRQAWLGSGLIDKCGQEIFDGDILDIDYDKAQRIIGDGSLVAEIKVMRLPTAVLVVKFSAARFRLVWRTDNGGVDTGKDLAMIRAILPAVEVIGHIAEVNHEKQHQN